MPIFGAWREFLLFLAPPWLSLLRLANLNASRQSGVTSEGSRSTCGGESGFEVAPKVLGVFQTDREPEGTVADSEALAHLRRQARVRHESGVLGQ